MGILEQQAQNPAGAPTPAGPATPGGPAASTDARQAEAQPEERERMEDVTGNGQAMTPEEQDIYDQIMVAMTEILFADETHDSIVKMLTDGAKTPEQTVAQVVVMLITQIDQASGNQIPEDMILPPIAEFVEQVCELANDSGAFPVDERMLQRCAQASLLQVADAYEMDPGEMEEIIAGLSEDKRNAIISEQSAHTNEPAPAPQEAV